MNAFFIVAPMFSSLVLVFRFYYRFNKFDEIYWNMKLLSLLCCLCYLVVLLTT
jgi:hypothetical protein